uniref:Terpene synthase 24 n=1 Tax=Tripterygium wilfordii TaxID=458696 RepID=A0A1B0YSM5_TRIWF|nr:terpene synthase 24 [Tripterygium wilfordii]
MALNHLSAPSLSICTFSGLNQPRNHISLMPSRKSFVPCPIKCTIADTEAIIRRSANFQPSIWDDSYIQSLKSDYKGGEPYVEQVNKMKIKVKMMLDSAVDRVKQLELIDTLQRLGLSYHFKEEIQRMIKSLYDTTCTDNTWKNSRGLDLYATALEFRILRQHGYKISQDVFSSFQDEKGNFKACISDDIEGMLHLYEATFLMVGGENILEDARKFTSVHLNRCVEENRDQDRVFLELVRHALELPLHWRLLRIEARWFIDVYERIQGMNPTLLEFAKLDFNMVQAMHQADLQYDSSWWASSGLPEKLCFTRDRLMENFLWAVGLGFEPQFGYMRRMNTKVHQLLTTVDDVYDIYGTLDEFELFTDVLQRWDIDAIEQLPEYMKMTFFAVYNAMNQIAFTALKEQGHNIIPCIKRVWGDLSRTYILEAKWFYSGYKPTLEEYLKNGWVSITAPAILIHAYLVSSPLSKEVLESLPEYPDIIRHPSMIVRLADDLGTSSDEIKRGDNPKSIQCYMNETGGSEEEAREHIHYLISETWKKINEEHLNADSPWPPIFKEIALNIARTAQAMYLYGDGHASQDHKVQARMESLFVTPIP